MKIWSHHQKRIETNLPNKSKRKQIDQLCLSLTAVEKNYIRRESKNAGMSMKQFVLEATANNRVIVMSGTPEILLAINRQIEVFEKLLEHCDAKVDSESIKASCQTCQNTYEQLVQFLDHWDVRLKRMEE